MKTSMLDIGGVPAILWGEKAGKLFLYIHGQGGCKEEARLLAENACALGYQVLSVDLPRHGAQENSPAAFEPWDVMPQLRSVMEYAKNGWHYISLFANSIGAWFSMLTFSDDRFEKCLFLSPVLDMNRLIGRMMAWANVSVRQLQVEKEIPTHFGQTLSWKYRQFALDHAITHWKSPTAILYATGDHLVERETVDQFCERFGCNLTVIEGGEHWFHTDAQIECLRKWLTGTLQTE